MLILGATGSLGRQVVREALADGHDVTVFVRTPSKLPDELRQRVAVRAGDLSVDVPSELVRGHDALINCAGHVSNGETFVALIDRVVSAVEPRKGRNCGTGGYAAGIRPTENFASTICAHRATLRKSPMTSACSSVPVV